MKKNIIFLNIGNYGGPGSFQENFIYFLKKRKISFSIKKILRNHKNHVLVLAGTRHILFLLFCKIRGIKIVQRLDGLIWHHRKNFPGLKLFFLSEIRFLLIVFIRKYLADKIIYQSKFSKNIWQNYDLINKPSRIIYNGSKTQFFKKKKINKKKIKFISVEGEINCEPMYSILKDFSNFSVDVYGKFDLKKSKKIKGNVRFKGSVKKNKILKILPKYDIFLSIELLPACSNSVIEAMSFGLPIFGFNSGSMPELVKNGGLLANYDKNPWKLESPNTKKLISMLPKLIQNYHNYSLNSWKRHNQFFSAKKMSLDYIDYIFEESF